MKNTWSAVLGLMLLAAPAVMQGQSGETNGYSYSINGDNSITITGYSGPSNFVTIPESIIGLAVTGIGANAFVYSKATNINIPSSVTNIAVYAFASCRPLRTINVDPQNLFYSSVGGVLFDYSQDTLISCPCGFDLTPNYTVPSSVTTITNYAFFGSTNLIAVLMSDQVTNICDYAFAECQRLESLEVSRGLQQLGSGVFSYCGNLTNIDIPDTITSIPDSLCDACGSLSNVAIGGEVQSIGSSAFEGCGSLTQFKMPSGLTNLGTGAFWGAGLTSIVIPSGIEAIQDITFWECQGLSNVTFLGPVASLGYQCFASCSGLTNFYIPETVTNIGGAAFVSCTQLASVNIPAGATNISDYTFAGCSSLTNIIIPSGTTVLGDSMFDGCSSLISVTIPDSVIAIGDGSQSEGDWVFHDCSSLANVSLPENLNYIGSGAFLGCSSLSNISIPSSVGDIGGYAFSACSALTNIMIPAAVSNIGPDVFIFCSSLTSIEVDPQNPYYASINGVLFDKAIDTLIQYPENLGGSYVVPNSVTQIADEAFFSAILTNVVIAGSVSIIGYGAFAGSSLETVAISNGVTYIEQDAFGSCPFLSSIIIPSSLSNIVEYAFDDSINLKSIYFFGNEPSILGSYQALDFFSNNTTIYYLPGTAGWTSNFGGMPAVLWNPAFGGVSVQTNQFEFYVSGTSNIPLTLEVCSNLEDAVWLPLIAGALTNGVLRYSEYVETNQAARFFRISPR